MRPRGCAHAKRNSRPLFSLPRPAPSSMFAEAGGKSATNTAPWNGLMHAHALEVEYVITLVAFFFQFFNILRDRWLIEFENRKDFLSEIKAKFRRNLTEAVVEDWLPPPVVSELRHVLEAGAPLTCGWRMPRASVLVANVAGFARLTGRLTPDECCQMMHELEAALEQASLPFRPPFPLSHTFSPPSISHSPFLPPL